MPLKSLVYLSFIFMINRCMAVLPSDIQLCKAEDVVCVSKITTEIIRNNPLGRSDIGIPQIDPFYVSNLAINQASTGPISLELSFKNLSVEGLSKMVVERAVGFSKDARTSKFEVYGFIPQLEIKGRYKISGKILLLPIQGEGNSNVILENPKVSVKFKPTVLTKENKTYLAVDKLKVYLEPERMKVNFENLFNGDPSLGKNMNTFLNENWKDVWTELASSINDAVAEITKSIMKPLFNKHSYDDVYLA